MVKLGCSPISSAWARIMRTPMAWKVPSHMPEMLRPIRISTRSTISRAARLVKVTASTSCGLARPVRRMWARRVVSTRVFPVPAPASTSNGPSAAVTAASCSGFSPVR
jgi:hypothetical protein